MNSYQLNELALEFRVDCGINHANPIDLFPLMTNKITDLTIVFLDMDSEVSGASYKFGTQKIMFINSNHTQGRQRFTAAHELYHLFYDDTTFTICNLNNNDKIEKQADQFASYLLMPINALYAYKKEKSIEKWDMDSIIDCEQYFQISHESLLYRLKSSNEINSDEYETYNQNIKYNALKRGYDLKLYEPYISKNYTIGNYTRLVKKCHENDLISNARKEEYLLDAFLSDLVYNLEEL